MTASGLGLWGGWDPIMIKTRICGGTVYAGYMVALSADNTVVLTSSQGEQADGLAMDDGTTGKEIRVMVLGYGPVVCTTASGFILGEALTPSATTDNGKVEAAASGDYVCGRIDDAPGADDDVVGALIDCVKPTIY